MTLTASPDPVLDAIRSARRHRVPLTLRLRLDPHGDAVDVSCTDVSATGAFISAGLLVPIGTRVWCSIRSADGATFESSAVVVRHQVDAPSGMGLVFENGCPLVERH